MRAAGLRKLMGETSGLPRRHMLRPPATPEDDRITKEVELSHRSNPSEN